MATRPHPSQTYFMAASLSLQTCLASVCIAPQKLHFDLSSHGLQRWPGASATAPQFLHVYAIGCPFHALSKFQCYQRRKDGFAATECQVPFGL